MSCLGEQLAGMVARGLMSLEDLDQPTPAWRELEEDRRRSLLADPSSGWPGRRTPAFPYPAAGSSRQLPNLARAWIEANHKAWQRLQQGYAQPAPDSRPPQALPPAASAEQPTADPYPPLVA
jgi:hypothetical protein